MFKFLFLGDVVGRVGRVILKQKLGELKAQLQPDLTVINGENSAGGLGIEADTADEIFSAGADIITTGNHIWNKKTFRSYLEKHSDRVIRPDNFAPGAPGRGWTVKEVGGVKVGIANLMGRVFMPDLVDCPFRGADKLLENELRDCKLIFIDFHGEATSEKTAFGNYLDGRVAGVFGTHTHVQTADERILPKGTAYISDVGMCGPAESVIGVETHLVVERFVTGLPLKFETATGPGMINGVFVTADPSSGTANSIERVKIL